jgi:hypothetical protein
MTGMSGVWMRTSDGVVLGLRHPEHPGARFAAQALAALDQRFTEGLHLERPAVLDEARDAQSLRRMFDDAEWDGSTSVAERDRFQRWASGLGVPSLAMVELGAGHGVPTIRRTSEMLVAVAGAKLVRINPRDADVPEGQIGVGIGALEALKLISRSTSRSYPLGIQDDLHRVPSCDTDPY